MMYTKFFYFLPVPPHVLAFGTDVYSKIHATSLKRLFFPFHPSSVDVPHEGPQIPLTS